MSLVRAIDMKERIALVLDRMVPLPSNTQEWQERIYATTKALADELAAWTIAQNPDVMLTDRFLVDVYTQFVSELLIPDAVQAVRQKQSERPAVRPS